MKINKIIGSILADHQGDGVGNSITSTKASNSSKFVSLAIGEGEFICCGSESNFGSSDHLEW